MGHVEYFCCNPKSCVYLELLAAEANLGRQTHDLEERLLEKESNFFQNCGLGCDSLVRTSCATKFASLDLPLFGCAVTDINRRQFGIIVEFFCLLDFELLMLVLCLHGNSSSFVNVVVEGNGPTGTRKSSAMKEIDRPVALIAIHFHTYLFQKKDGKPTVFCYSLDELMGRCNHNINATVSVLAIQRFEHGECNIK